MLQREGGVMNAADTKSGRLSVPKWVLEHASDESNLYATSLAESGRVMIAPDACDIVVDRQSTTRPDDLIAVEFMTGELYLYRQALAIPERRFLGKTPGSASDIEMLVGVLNNADLSRVMFLPAEKIREVCKVIAYRDNAGEVHLVESRAWVTDY